ncbi:DUF927 domain-containing protein [Streptomyces sp. NPDC020379]|uniref:DUF927 domain-containing protein n=1 Tax=Streptomyces sp. NPDC020379 TaxID=3365071 RepID=UPI0037B1086F
MTDGLDDGPLRENDMLSTLFGLPEAAVVPENYRILRDGVDAVRFVRDQPAWVRVAHAALVITRIFEDPYGEQSVELAWTDHHRGVVRRTVSKSVARRGKELVKQLGDAGLPCVESDARLVEKWLAEFEAVNREVIPREWIARQLGWQPDGTFAAAPGGERTVEPVYKEQLPPLRAHRRSGTVAGWRQAITVIAELPTPHACLAASFAAPLLKPLGLDSFTVDVSCRSTRGKTIALMAALSVWADPSEQADAIASWRTSLIAIEKRLNLVSGLPVVLDETMTVDAVKMVDDVLYQVPKNCGKARGGGWPSMLPWHTVVLSSGEQPALAFTTHQGASARVLCLTGPPFPDRDRAQAVRESVCAHHGHAGAAFAEELVGLLHSPGGREALLKRHQELTDRFLGGSDMTGRRAPMAAVLALADELAAKWGIVPFGPMKTEVWAGLFTSGGAVGMDDRPEMAMEIVRAYVAAHHAELWRPFTVDQRAPYQGWLGRITSEGRVAIPPERLRRVLEDAGYSLAAVPTTGRRSAT